MQLCFSPWACRGTAPAPGKNPGDQVRCTTGGRRLRPGDPAGVGTTGTPGSLDPPRTSPGGAAPAPEGDRICSCEADRVKFSEPAGKADAEAAVLPSPIDQDVTRSRPVDGTARATFSSI